MRCLQAIKAWYQGLTQGEAVIPSLSDTQFFWITLVWLSLFPFVTYAVFWLGIAQWSEYLVFASLEVFVLAFKFAKYINVGFRGATFELHQEKKEAIHGRTQDQNER